MEIASYDVKNMYEVNYCRFVTYIVKCIRLFGSGMINTDSMINNLSAAIVLQFMLMEQSDRFKEESARYINNSSTYSAMQKLTAYICVVFFKGT